MLDIGFGELLVVVLVAIVMLGPDRCIKLFREAGKVWKRIETQWKDVKNTIDD